MNSAFDDLVRLLDTSMVIVTTADGAERAGCLAGFHSQTSIAPPRYAVWLSTANYTYRVAAEAPAIAVNLIGVDDHDLAELFGGETGDDTDKFDQCSWQPGPHGVPLLERCPNRMVLERVTMLDGGGDHMCFVGIPIDVATNGKLQPLRLSAASDIAAGHPVKHDLKNMHAREEHT